MIHRILAATDFSASRMTTPLSFGATRAPARSHAGAVRSHIGALKGGT